MKNRLAYPLIAAVAAFTGCTSWLPSVGPDYETPEMEDMGQILPDAGCPTTNLTKTCEYEVKDAKDDVRATLTPESVARWWNQFEDPILTGLISHSISNNLSYKVAVSRLAQAQWELFGTYSAFLPKFGVNADWSQSVNRQNNRSLYDTGTISRRTQGPNLGVGADWEIDIFGGSRRATEAAIAQWEAAGFGVEDSWIRLACEIGSAYIALRTTQARIVVARNNLKLQSETYDILRSRLESGIGDELAVNQCAYVVEQTRARIPALLADEEKGKNALAILVGTMPGALAETLKAPETPRDWLVEPQKVASLPLDLIRSRPDVRVAERQLAAQVASIGVAKAQWYPRLFITGSVGVQSKHFGNLFEYDSLMSSFGPSVTWPIFQAGKIYSSVKAEEEKTRQAALNYSLAIDRAYADVRNWYAAYTQEYHRYLSLQAAVKAATDAVTISQDLYKNGLKDFNNVLDAQRSRLEFEENLVVSRGQISADLLNLYRALGGGIGMMLDTRPTEEN